MAFSRRFLSFLFAISIISVSLPSCKSQKPMQGAVQSNVPKAPNYSDLRYWAAHPDKKDSADCVPLNCDLKDEQTSAEVDVFFLHPTTLINGGGWNGDVDDAALNKKTDGGPIQYQASIFNGAGRIYAPRYRQAHYHSYFTKDTATAMAAFELAYQDVKTAFEYYLEHWNNGRPIIIASHSQGTTHAKRLLKEYFDGKNLKNRLVVAYLAGMPITKNYFNTIPVCEAPEQTGCFCSWRTFKEGYEPRRGFLPRDSTVAVVNPLSWTTQSQLVPKEKHEGFVLVGFKAIGKNNIETQIHKGTLWASKPSFKGSILFRTKNYHIGDFNLFYFNIREDAKRRVGLFWKQ